MTTVKAVLNRDRVKKKGGYSLVIQILHRRSKRVIYTPYILNDEDFDPMTQMVLFTEKSAFTRKQIGDINRFIAKKKRELEKIILLVSARNTDFSCEDIIREYRQEQSNRYLNTYIERLIERKEKMGKSGIAKALRSTLRSLNKFIGNRTVVFNDITPIFAKEYETHLAGTGIKQNTINFYIRNFRSIYNLALESGVEMVDHMPFRKIHLRNEKTVKRALKKEIIEQIAKVNLTADKELDQARDLFMFSFYTRGMSFVDVVCLKHKDIADGVIYYKRHKTNRHMQVTIIPELQVIIDKYMSSDLYVLPFMSFSDAVTPYKRYQKAYRILHRGLKKLQKRLRLTTPLTMHVARHSWATIAKESGANTAAISQGLGHATEKTTEIYLKDFDFSVIDAINVQVVNFSMRR
ncbi:MAG: site-specific integrase [Lachnospiraceae bacterium]